MAQFHLQLDNRVKLRNDKYNLCVRLNNGNDVMYLKIVPLTVDQYNKVFVKKAMDQKSVKFREESNQFLAKCESEFSQMKHFDKQEYRRLVYGKSNNGKHEPDSLLLTDLVKRYIEANPNIKLHTKDMYFTAVNSFEDYRPGIAIIDITPTLLFEYERKRREQEMSSATISCYMRHLRGVVNHFMDVDPILPPDFRYPFGKRDLL